MRYLQLDKYFDVYLRGGAPLSGLRLFETDYLLVRWPRAIAISCVGATAGGVSLAIRIPELLLSTYAKAKLDANRRRMIHG
jgi:hypothetical protein